MKRRSRKPKRSHKQAGRNSARMEETLTRERRRRFLLRIRNYAVATGLILAAGWYVTSEVSAGAKERDLSRIGNGIAAVVQIHDPQCSKCLALQSQTREALRAFDENELQYLVANIRLPSGQRFASRHRVRHVTLVLFDAKGKRRAVLVGNRQAEELQRHFRRHLKKSS